MLFHDKIRTRTAPKSPGEDDFAFYDSTARPEFQIYRNLLNGWVAELPDAEHAETIARFQKNNSLGYQAALAELTIHAALIRQGYKVTIHPTCAHQNHRPDFLATGINDEPVAYIEVTSFGPTQDHVAQSNREATIYNAIDAAKPPPGFRFTYDVQTYGKASPNTKKLCKEIELWAKDNQEKDPEKVPSKVFEADDWQIEIGLFGGFSKDVQCEKSIGGAMGDIRTVSPEIEIRAALNKKGSRYGDFLAPYVIVVMDCKDELQGGEQNAEALQDAAFGSIVTEVKYDSLGKQSIENIRCNDGYFGRSNMPRHQNVSAVILLPRPHLWDLRSDRWQPQLLKNPWATFQLPNSLLPLPGYEYNAEIDAFARVEGTQLADILEIPEIWPPEYP